MKQKCAKDLRAFAPAAIPSHPDTLSTGPLPLAKHRKTLAWTGGRGETGFLPGVQKPVSPRLIRPG
jgi:hypothetical protein